VNGRTGVQSRTLTAVRDDQLGECLCEGLPWAEREADVHRFFESKSSIVHPVQLGEEWGGRVKGRRGRHSIVLKLKPRFTVKESVTEV